MAHLFFSYAHADADRMYPIHRKMETLLGRKLWIDRIGLWQGIEWENAIKLGIDQSYGIIFAVTKAFVASKFISEKEIPWSIDHFKNRQGPLLFVLRFDDVEIPPALKALPDYQCQVIDAIGIDFKKIETETTTQAQNREQQNQQALARICHDLKLPAEQEGDQPFIVSWPRLDNFKGRDDLLGTLHQQLGEGAVGVNSAGLYGMGGIGKTQLAVEYAYRYRYYYPAGVYWINAVADWSGELVSLADRLGLEPTDKSDTDRARQKIIALERYLKKRAVDEDGDALIVMDNVENPADLTTQSLANGAMMLGTAASFCAQARAKLLVTTRRRDLPAGLGKIEVSVLAPLDARAVLLDTHPTERDVLSIDTLCKAVGYLPLPLGWFAAALRSDPDLSPSDLLNELHGRNIDAIITDIHEQGVTLGTPEHYAALTGIAFNWGWDQLKSDDAHLILMLAAAFEEAAIIPLARLRFLSGIALKLGIRQPFKLAIKALLDFSLIEPQTDSTALRLHPLVREFVRGKSDSQVVLTVGAEHLVAAYRTPSILAEEAKTRGFESLISDLRTTHDILSTPCQILSNLLRLFMLEEHKLATLLSDIGGTYVVQQIRERAYHESDNDLAMVCDIWLANKPYLIHVGTLRYPQAKTLLHTLNKHRRLIYGALQLHDGRLLSWSADMAIWLWSERGESLARFKGHTSNVTGALELRDGRLLSWSTDMTLRLWNGQGELLAQLKGHNGSISGALELRDGRILSWSAGSWLWLWNKQGEPIARLGKHTSSVSGALELRDERILSWSEDKNLQLWGTQGEPLISLRGHSDKVTGALELRDGRILSWSEDKTLRLWNDQGDPLIRLEGHTSNVTGALELRDGRILSWSEDKTLRLWNDQGDPLIRLEGHTSNVTGALELRDGRILSWSGGFWGHVDNTLRLWSIEGEQSVHLDGHTDRVSRVIELRDERLLSWSDDKTLQMWSKQGEPLGCLKGHTNRVGGALELRDGRILSWADDKTLRLWSKQGELLGCLKGHTNRVGGALELRDGRILSWAGVFRSNSNETLRLWSGQGELLSQLEAHYNVIGALELRNGRLLSWADDKTLQLWSEQGKPLANLEGHTEKVAGALELRDGRILSWSGDAFGQSDESLRLWTRSGEPLVRLDGHSSSISGALELRDGRILSWSGEIYGRSDRILRLWTRSGEPLARLDGHSSSISGALELRDGRILSWSNDSTLRLWTSGGNLSLVHYSDAPITCCLVHSSGLIVAGDSQGRLLFLRLGGS